MCQCGTSLLGPGIKLLLGFIFVPWTALMYVPIAPGGIVGFD